MQARLKSWWHTIWQRKWWFVLLFLYKIIEDWGLGKLIGYVEEHKGTLVVISDFIISYLPWITWIAVPVTILILVVKSWLDSAKSQPAIVSTQNLEHLNQVIEQLNELIKHGEDLTEEMRGPDFHKGHVGQEVRQWLDKTEHDVWEMVPEHARCLAGNEKVTQEPYTDQERLRYAGWDRNAAALRVSVDRRLVQLREIRSRIEVSYEEAPQS